MGKWIDRFIENATPFKIWVWFSLFIIVFYTLLVTVITWWLT